ncbi:MAG: V-type ATP synthase subunit K [Firmicutes bacterium]|jgi:V/A-type H+-transporting ATPase subunit K|nr:V-type ATP synthase subunit K [Bacillota bacterium]
MNLSVGGVLAFIAVGIAVGFPGIGSAIGVGLVGKAGSGVITEDPDKFGQILLLQAIPGTQGIYGLLTGLMIMMRVGVLGGTIPSIPALTGVMLIGSAIPIGLVGWLSAISQGKVAAAGVSIVAKRPEEMGKAVIFAAMVETYAVLALLASLLLLFSIQI